MAPAVKDVLGGPVSPVLNTAAQTLLLTSPCSHGLRFSGHCPLAMHHRAAKTPSQGSGPAPEVPATPCPRELLAEAGTAPFGGSPRGQTPISSFSRCLQ